MKNQTVKMNSTQRCHHRQNNFLHEQPLAFPALGALEQLIQAKGRGLCAEPCQRILKRRY
jgi:hypothetical protein